MTIWSRNTLLASLCAVLMTLPAWQSCVAAEAFRSGAFVTREGSALTVDGMPFRFSGANIHWLGLDGSSPHYPSHARIDQVLDDAERMHATVVRAHTLGISVGCSICIEPALDRFNEDAFDSIDYAIASARRHHIRLIIPLVDNYHYYHGGKHTFTDWRGIKDENKFFTDPTVIGDFKRYVAHIIKHINRYTGIPFKDDSTILAWETGNELSVYPAPWNHSGWTEGVARYIKSIDPHHLVADGHYGIYTINSVVDTRSLELPDVDMYSNHAYDDFRTPEKLVSQGRVVQSYGKVFFIGEYSWTGTNAQGKPDVWTLPQLLATVEATPFIAGDLYWQLYDPGEAPSLLTLHYPGDTASMRNAVRELAAHARKMRRAR